MKTHHIACYASVAAALLLSACGGGVADSLENERNLVSRQEARLVLIEGGDTSPELLAAFNDGAVALQEVRLDTGFLCGAQGGRQLEFLACVQRLKTLTTPQPQFFPGRP